MWRSLPVVFDHEQCMKIVQKNENCRKLLIINLLSRRRWSGWCGRYGATDPTFGRQGSRWQPSLVFSISKLPLYVHIGFIVCDIDLFYRIYKNICYQILSAFCSTFQQFTVNFCKQQSFIKNYIYQTTPTLWTNYSRLSFSQSDLWGYFQYCFLIYSVFTISREFFKLKLALSRELRKQQLGKLFL